MNETNVKEWLLSGHNTLESTTIARPLTVTGVEKNINIAIDWFLKYMLDGILDLDDSIPPAVTVQGLVYLNVDYSVQNAAFPFDPASLGVPVEFVQQHPEYVVEKSQIPPTKMPAILRRFRQLYRWAADFYEQQLPILVGEFRQLYWDLRQDPDAEELAWRMFSPQYKPVFTNSGRAHEIVSIPLVILDSLLRQHAPQLLNLFAGRSTITSQMSQRVWELRQVAGGCGEEVTRRLQAGVVDPDVYAAIPQAAPFVEALEAFLQDYGHRGFRYEFDMMSDRIADHPQQVLLAVAGQLKAGVAPEERAQAARLAAEDTLRHMTWPKRALWSRVLEWAQRLIAWRENTKSFQTLQQSIAGIAVRSLSRRFYPNDPDDTLLFYTFDEFEAFIDSRGEKKVEHHLLDRRRAEFELHLSQPPPPETIWYHPHTRLWRPAIEEKEPQSISPAATRFEGIGASPGTGPVEGVALVTNDPYEAGQMLLETEGPVVLVTRLTDPAWSSLFARLAAVVTERGGVISHAAIIARENGLPAVASVPDVTQRIRNGQRVRVDGYSGVVEILD
jgi:phosphohistidine swiveling domain-containing protein